jgi:uncharacterized OsmC-like protein
MTIAERLPTTSRRGKTEYHVNARTDATGAAVIDAAGSPILFHPTSAQVADGLPGPAELLASALAACLLKNLSQARTLLAFEYDEAQVDVTVESQDRPPRFVSMAYTLRVATDEPEHRVALMHASLRKYGRVYNTLASVCDVQGSVEVVPRTRRT